MDDDLAKLADEFAARAATSFVRRMRSLTDFCYDERQVKYWDTTSGELLEGKSVDGAIPKHAWPTEEVDGKVKLIRPSVAINDVSTGLTVESSTWWPGKPRFMLDVVVTERGVLDIDGAVCYNTYRPADHRKLDLTGDAGPWIAHVERLYTDPVERSHFFDFVAHMIQRPEEKVNHGLVMAGTQGIGKDSALLPVRIGVGEHNAAEIQPDDIASQFNPHVQSVLLVINEVRPHDEDFKAANFYNKLKPLLAAPPDLLPLERKFANRVYVRNLCHVILTTNDPLTMYIPAEDRRLFVMTSELPDPKTSAVFPAGYFAELHKWFRSGGVGAVIGWLLARDLSAFDAGAPPPMTAGKRAIIESSVQVRRSPVDDILDRFFAHVYADTKPDVIFLKDLIDFVNFGAWFDDKRVCLSALQAKAAHFKLHERGFAMVKPDHATEWRRGDFRSRLAFVSREIPADLHAEKALEALGRRPLMFQTNEPMKG